MYVVLFWFVYNWQLLMKKKMMTTTTIATSVRTAYRLQNLGVATAAGLLTSRAKYRWVEATATSDWQMVSSVQQTVIDQAIDRWRFRLSVSYSQRRIICFTTALHCWSRCVHTFIWCFSHMMETTMMTFRPNSWRWLWHMYKYAAFHKAL